MAPGKVDEGTPTGDVVLIDYENYQGRRQPRRILVQYFWLGVSQYHGDKRQWFCRAIDLDISEVRDYALAGVHEWRTEE